MRNLSYNFHVGQVCTLFLTMIFLAACGSTTPSQAPPNVAASKIEHDAGVVLSFPDLKTTVVELTAQVDGESLTPGFGPQTNLGVSVFRTGPLGVHGEGAPDPKRPPQINLDGLTPGKHTVRIKGFDANGISLYETTINVNAEKGNGAVGFGLGAVPKPPQAVSLERSLTSLNVHTDQVLNNTNLIVRVGGISAALKLQGTTYSGIINKLFTQDDALVVVEARDNENHLIAQGFSTTNLTDGNNNVDVKLHNVKSNSSISLRPALQTQSIDHTELSADYLLPLKITDSQDQPVQNMKAARVEWGDGTSERLVQVASALTIRHRFTDSGSYTVTTWVQDQADNWTAYTQTVVAGNGNSVLNQQSLATVNVTQVPNTVTSIQATFSPVPLTAAEAIRGVPEYPEQLLDLGKRNADWGGSTLIWKNRPYYLWLYAVGADGSQQVKRSVYSQVNLTADGTINVDYQRAFGCQIGLSSQNLNALCGGGGGDGNGNGDGGNSIECTVLGYCNSLHMMTFRPRPHPRPSIWSSNWGGGFAGGSYLSGPGGGGWGVQGVSLITGGAWGDPHITTLGGGHFTSLQLGEFIYLIPTDGATNGLELQVRHTRLPGLPDWASFNTAAAVHVDGHIYQVSIPKNRVINANNELLIDGQPTDLAPGNYTMGPASTLEVNDGNNISLLYLPSGATSPIKLYIGTQADKSLVRKDLTTPAYSLNINAIFPQQAAYRGIFGTPDGDSSNEMTLPDGKITSNISTFMEAWRVTKRNDSLFTYIADEGPETYNIEQTAPQPTVDKLITQGYVDQAKSLLKETCKANIDAIDSEFIQSLALEIAAGRSSTNLVESGLCGDLHVDGAGETDPPFVQFNLTGQVFLKDTQIPTSGAKVIVIDKASGKKLCETIVVEDGRYSCGASDFASNYTAPLTLEYKVSGRGPSVTTTKVVTDLSTDQPISVAQDFFISPEVIVHMKGSIADGNGQAISGLMNITQPIMNRVGFNNGNYDAYLALPDGVRNGEIQLAVMSNGKFGSQTIPFDLKPDAKGIVELPQDLKIALSDGNPYISDPAQKFRNLVFTGRVLNAHLKTLTGKDIGVANLPIKIISTGLQGGSCNTTTDIQGQYSCHAYLIDDQPFNVVLDVDSGGLTKNININSQEIPVKAMSLSHREDATYQPTTVVVQGAVKTSSGDAIENATVNGSIGDLTKTPLQAQQITSSDGQYVLYFTLPRSTTTLNGNVALQVNLKTATAQASQSATPSFTVDNGQLVTVNQNFTLNTRVLSLTGRITDHFVPNLGVSKVHIIIKEANAGTVCDTTTDLQGLYQCSLAVSDQSLSFTYDVLSDGGAHRDAVNFDPSKLSVGTRGVLSQSFEVSPATIKLSGHVVDASGKSAIGGVVHVVSAKGTQDLTVGMDGTYLTYLTLPADQLSGSLNLTATYKSAKDNLSGTADLPYNMQAAALTSLTQDISLNGTILDAAQSAKVTFEGEVRNRNFPGAALQGVNIEVWGVGTSASAGRICSTTSAVISETVDYTCSSTFVTDRDLSVEYRATLNGESLGNPIQATWHILQDTAFGTTVTQDLVYSPKTLIVQGHATDQTGRPLSQITVQADGVGYSVVTDDTGHYEYGIPMASTQQSGQLKLTGTLKTGNLTATVTKDYLASEDITTLQDVNLQFPITARQLILTGHVTNTLVPAGQAIGGLSINMTLADGTSLCKVLTDSNGNYRCPVVWNAGDPLAVKALIAGQTFDVSLTDIPVPGGERVYINNFDVAPATLHLTGTVRDVNGNVLSYPTLTLRDPANKNEQTTFGQESGHYDWYVAFDTPNTLVNLQLLGAHISGVTGSANVSIPLPLGQLQTVNQDLKLLMPEDLNTTLRLIGILKDDFGNPVPNTTLELSGELKTVLHTDASGQFSAFFALPASKTYVETSYKTIFTEAKLPFEMNTNYDLISGQLNVKNQIIQLPDLGILKISPQVANGIADEPLEFTTDTTTFSHSPEVKWTTTGGEITPVGLKATYIPAASLSDQTYTVTAKTGTQLLDAKIEVPAVHPKIDTSAWDNLEKPILYAGLPIPLSGTGLNPAVVHWTADGGTLKNADSATAELIVSTDKQSATISYGHAKYPDVKATTTLPVVVPTLTLDNYQAQIKVGHELAVKVLNMPSYVCNMLQVSKGRMDGCTLRYTPDKIGYDEVNIGIPNIPQLNTTIKVEVVPPVLTLNPKKITVALGEKLTLNADILGFDPVPTLTWKASAGQLKVDGVKAELTVPNNPGQIQVTVTGAGQQAVAYINVVSAEIHLNEFGNPSIPSTVLPQIPFVIIGSGIEPSEIQWKVDGAQYTVDPNNTNIVTIVPPMQEGNITITYNSNKDADLKSIVTTSVKSPTLSFQDISPITVQTNQDNALPISGVPSYACNKIKTTNGSIVSTAYWDYMHGLYNYRDPNKQCTLIFTSTTPKVDTVTLTIDGFPDVTAIATIETVGHPLYLYRTDVWAYNPSYAPNVPVNIGETAMFRADISGFANSPTLTWKVDGGTITPSPDGLTAMFTAPGYGSEGIYTVTVEGGGQSVSYNVYVIRPRANAITHEMTAQPDESIWANTSITLTSSGLPYGKGQWSASGATFAQAYQNPYNYEMSVKMTPPDMTGPITIRYSDVDFPQIFSETTLNVIKPQVSIESSISQAILGEAKVITLKGIPYYECNHIVTSSPRSYFFDEFGEYSYLHYMENDQCQFAVQVQTIPGNQNVDISFDNNPDVKLNTQFDVQQQDFKLISDTDDKIHSYSDATVHAVDMSGNPYKGSLFWSVDNGSIYDSGGVGSGVANVYTKATSGTIIVTASPSSDSTTKASIPLVVYRDPIQLHLYDWSNGYQQIDNPTVYASSNQSYQIVATRPNNEMYPGPIIWSTDGGVISQSQNSYIYFSADTPGEYHISARLSGTSEPIGTIQVTVVEPPKAPLLHLDSGVTSPIQMLNGQGFKVFATDESGQPYPVPLQWSFHYSVDDSSGVNFVNNSSSNNTDIITAYPYLNSSTQKLTITACSSLNSECSSLDVDLQKVDLNNKILLGDVEIPDTSNLQFMVGEQVRFQPTINPTNLDITQLQWTAQPWEFGSGNSLQPISETLPINSEFVISSDTEVNDNVNITLPNSDNIYSAQISFVGPTTSLVDNTQIPQQFPDDDLSNEGYNDAIYSGTLTLLPGERWTMTSSLPLHTGTPDASWNAEKGTFNEATATMSTYTAPSETGTFKVKYQLAKYPAAGNGVTVAVLDTGIYLDSGIINDAAGVSHPYHLKAYDGVKPIYVGNKGFRFTPKAIDLPDDKFIVESDQARIIANPDGSFSVQPSAYGTDISIVTRLKSHPDITHTWLFNFNSSYPSH